MAWVIGIGIFLFLLFAFPRAMVGLLVLCGLAIGGWLLWTKLDTDKRARERATVSVTVAYDLERCSPEYPLFVGILNDSDNTIEAVSFGIEGHRAGYSEPLYDSGYLGYSSDRIIVRGDSWASCWSLPRQAYGASEQSIALNPPNTLVWTAKNTSPRFRAR
jgi:hypothetical protein